MSVKLKVLTVAVMIFLCSPTFAQILPEPIALPSSEFPVATARLDALLAANDQAGLRAHAWKLWSGIVADSTQTFGAQKLPIWETWLSQEEVFSSTGPALAPERRNLRPFAPPRQFSHVGTIGLVAQTLKPPSDADKARVLAFVKFSPDSATFVRTPHTTAGAPSTFSYGKVADLNRLNAFFNQNNTAVANRKIVDFPAAATDLKVVFWPVKARGFTGLPIWNGASASTQPTAPDSTTWTTCVAVDPTNQATGSASVDCNGKTVSAPVVHINRFYSVRLDGPSAAAVTAALALSAENAVAEGDYQILVAIHVTTKEIANWTWQTFWWQDGKDPPGKFPGSMDGLPDQATVKGPWRNYAMCVADSTVIPPTNPQGNPIVCFNPYLEAGQIEGIRSNCMSCHARATQRPAAYPESYTPNGWVDPADPTIFGGRVKTDFVWAIPNAAN